MREAVRAVGPSWIINCAAFTDVERAESEPEAARRLNDVAVGHLADAALDAGARLMHFSTDYVFSGDFRGASPRPYVEEDPPEPINAYGASKLAGERRLERHPVRSTVLRTSWLYGGPGKSFLHAILRRGEEALSRGEPLRVVDDIDSAPTFSPDGRRLAFLRGDPAAGRNYVMVANSDGSAARQLGSVEPPDQLQLNAVSWSPDGRTILTTFQSLREGPHNGCMAIDAETGAARSVCGRWTAVNDVTWMPDGRSFLASAVEFGGFTPQLWQVSYPSGERRRITNDLNNYIGVSVSADGRSIATVQAENISNIWVMPADASAPGSQITIGRGRGDGLSGISWTPDGRIVFSSTASGAPQIWIMNADGTGQVQLTNDDRPSLAPAASGDGRYAVFQRIAEDGIFLHRVSLDASGSTRLTASGADFAPVTSRDGRWVYYYSPASGAPRPFKIPVDGGQPTALGDVYFRPVAVSPDDTRLLGISWDEKQRRSTLASLPVDGGVPTLLGLPAIAIASWSPDGQSVVYVDAQDGVLNLWSRALDGGTPRKLTNFTSDIVFWFAFSRDGRRLALARGTGSSDVVVIARK